MSKKQMGSLICRKIVGARNLSLREQNDAGWHFPAVVLILDDGTELWPSSDEEGNSAGCLFGVMNGHDFRITRAEEV
jgi:hypothetical protein